MLAPEAVALGRDRAVIVLTDRRREFQADVERIQISAIDRGMYRSGVTQQQFGDAIREEYRVRANEIWSVFSEVVDDRSLALDGELSERLKDLVSGLLDSHSDDLRAWHQTASDILPETGAAGSLEGYRLDALSRAATAIDLAALKARESVCEEDPNDDVVFELKPNFHGVGINLKALWRRIVRPKA